jgi:hypothetical protein
MGVVAACLWFAVVSGGSGRSAAVALIYLRCVVKAVPMAMAAGAANLLAGVWAATGSLLAGLTARGRGQGGGSYAAAWTAVRFSVPT